VWLREYLNVSPSRPDWAFVADILMANAAEAAARSVEPNARMNTFLQTWNVSTRKSAGLPYDLRRMVKAAEKYGVRLEAANPTEDIKGLMPTFYHIGMIEGRSTANTVASKCLRNRHGVMHIISCNQIALRLEYRGHTKRATCSCPECEDDRSTKGCGNPSRCVDAAYKIISRINPLWKPERNRVWDNLTITKRRREANERARETNERIIFDPTITEDGPLAGAFRVFVQSQDQRVRPARRPPRPFNVPPIITEVFTDGSCERNGERDAKAGSGVWFGPSNPQNVAAKVPGPLQSNQAAEMFAISLAVARTTPFIDLHINTD
ncbi:hypothetical protein LXA43DRAFT_838081, partial [Ganoderma leucocontextum]